MSSLGLRTESPAPPASARRRPRRAVWGVAVVVILCVAAIGVGGWIYLNRGTGAPTSQAGTTTGLSALTLVEAGLPKSGGQSWTLFSDIGIASPTPFTPWVLGGDPGSSANQLATIWACGSLPLTTVWNVSGLSSAAGNVSDGYAPFWQFMFENQSVTGQPVFEIGSYSQGRVEVVGPLPQSNACIEDLGLGPGTPLPGASQPNLDTNLGGPLAYANAASEFGPEFGPYALLWLDGLPMIANTGWDSFYSTGGAAWQASYYDCGLAGSVPPPNAYNSYHVSVWLENGTPEASGPLAVEFNCTLPNYGLSGAAHPAAGGVDPTSPRVALTVRGPFGGGAQEDAQGVAAWMLDPSIADSSQATTAPSVDLCSTWVSGLSSCASPDVGWYGVLLSPSGTWLDSYGVVNGTVTWAAPNVPVLSNETFVVLASSATDLAGMALSFTPQVHWPDISTSSIPL